MYETEEDFVWGQKVKLKFIAGVFLWFTVFKPLLEALS